MSRNMVDSGVEWIGKIPEGWEIKRFRYVIDSLEKGNGITKEDIFVDGDTPCVRYGEIYSKYNHSFVNCISRTKKERLSLLQYFTKGDILFAGTGELVEEIGKSIVYLGVEKCLAGGDIIVAKHSQNPSFLNYALNSEYAQIQKSCGKTKLKVIHISAGELKNILMFLPSLDIQQRIADFLDKKCSAIDDVLAKTQESIEEYKKLKQAVITEAVTKGIRGKRPMKDSGIDWIGEMPKDWSVHKVKRLLFERKDRSNDGTEEPLSMSQVYGLVPTKELDSIPNMASSFIGAKLVYVGDLVFNKLKAHLGVFSVSKHDGLVSPDYAVYQSTGLVDLTYLEFLFKTPQCIHEFKKRITGVGAGLSRLYTDELFSISCSIPPIEEQVEISRYLYEKRRTIDALIAKKQQFIEELTAYKKSLIYEYVTGKKEVPA